MSSLAEMEISYLRGHNTAVTQEVPEMDLNPSHKNISSPKTPKLHDMMMSEELGVKELKGIMVCVE